MMRNLLMFAMNEVCALDSGRSSGTVDRKKI